VRPVNLIPPDLRRGDNAPLRTGPVVYIVLGALVLVLAGVTMLVLTDNKISDRKADVVRLHREDAAAKAKAERLAAYTQFQTMSEQRLATVQSLANSRFDWERVMRELALVLPKDVWLVSLNAAASPSEGSSESGGGGLTGSVQGPSLSLSGCTSSQDAVAGFVTALKDIDGVTRVGLESSTAGGGSGATNAEGGGGGGCESGDSVTQFSLIVAFDAAPAPITAEAAAEPTATTPEGGSEGESGSEGSEGG
jgi:Tfp pilus assembly protein PilN